MPGGLLRRNLARAQGFAGGVRLGLHGVCNVNGPGSKEGKQGSGLNSYLCVFLDICSSRRGGDTGIIEVDEVIDESRKGLELTLLEQAGVGSAA